MSIGAWRETARLIKDLIEIQKETVKMHIEQMQETLKTLEYKEWYYETAKKAGTCEVHKHMKKEDVPKEFWDMAGYRTGEAAK